MTQRFVRFRKRFSMKAEVEKGKVDSSHFLSAQVRDPARFSFQIPGSAMPRQKFCSVPGCLSNTELIKKEQEEFLSLFCDQCQVQRPCRCPAPDIYTTRKETRTKFTSWCTAIGLKSPGYYINVCHKHFSTGCPSRACPNPDVVKEVTEDDLQGPPAAKQPRLQDTKKVAVKRKALSPELPKNVVTASRPLPVPTVVPSHILSSLLLHGYQRPEPPTIVPLNRLPLRIALPTEPLPRSSTSSPITTTAVERQCPAIVALAPATAPVTSTVAPVIVAPQAQLPPTITLPQTPLPPSALTIQTVGTPSLVSSLPTPPSSSTDSSFGEDSASSSTPLLSTPTLDLESTLGPLSSSDLPSVLTDFDDIVIKEELPGGLLDQSEDPCLNDTLKHPHTGGLTLDTMIHHHSIFAGGDEFDSVHKWLEICDNGTN